MNELTVQNVKDALTGEIMVAKQALTRDLVSKSLSYLPITQSYRVKLETEHAVSSSSYFSVERAVEQYNNYSLGEGNE